MKITIDGSAHEIEAGQSCRDAFKSVLSGKKYKACIAARCGDKLLDLDAPIPNECQELEPINADSPEGLDILRHSVAHIMAAAVLKLFPETKVTIGPAISTGFYYDFDKEKAFSPEDLEAIKKEMDKIIKSSSPFTRKVMSKDEAIKFFEEMGEKYKVEIISEIEDKEVSLYTLGDFVDLCRGPHIPDSSFVKAYELLSVAGAYWRGDEKNKMLSRIYGTAFATPQELKKHLNMLEEAKKRDHRKLGRELDLFDFHEDVAPGMAFWHPKGMILRTILEDFLIKEHLKRGYELVRGPQMLRTELWEKSGHYDNYRENMYFTSIEEDSYGIKPMNCLAHMLIYGSHTRSYRDLPVRLFELGIVHRHERSGTLHGLLRVRQFTQDDAHIICPPDQLESEIVKVMSLVHDIFSLFGFEYKLEVSTRPEKSIGTDEDWELATEALKQALDNQGLPYAINEGDGAFYGPKIDCQVLDSLGREWQCSTIQVDFTLPERFDLSYIGQDGDKHKPVMVHRAILGSLERFIGILIEHCAGAFPTWLAPLQARVINITDDHQEYANEILTALKAAGIRADADLRNEKLGYKVRAAQLEKIPYVLVIGDKELEDQGVNIRLRSGDSLGFKKIDETIEIINKDSSEPFNRGGMNYRFS